MKYFEERSRTGMRISMGIAASVLGLLALGGPAYAEQTMNLEDHEASAEADSSGNYLGTVQTDESAGPEQARTYAAEDDHFLRNMAIGLGLTGGTFGGVFYLKKRVESAMAGTNEVAAPIENGLDLDDWERVKFEEIERLYDTY